MATKKVKVPNPAAALIVARKQQIIKQNPLNAWGNTIYKPSSKPKQKK